MTAADPTDGGTGATVPAAGDAAGATPSSGASGSTGATTGGLSGSKAPVAGAASAGGGCVSPPGSDQGVTSTEVKIAIILLDTSGSGSITLAFDIPPTAEQKANWQIVVDDINAHGGVACRKFVPLFFTANPVDQADVQQKCLDVVAAHPFAVVDTGAYFSYPALAVCYPQHQLPFFNSGVLPQELLDRHYPYMFGSGTFEVFFRNFVFGLKDRGFFSSANGFKKLGYLYRDCLAGAAEKVTGWLHDVGVSDDQVVTYNLGCPSGFAAPSDLQQAILKFQQNGVTHVTETQAGPDYANFTTLAQQQRFKPKYGMPDDVVFTAYSTNHPDFDNIADTIVITSSRIGEEHTPGLMNSNPGTVRCQAIFKAAGRPPIEDQTLHHGGLTCDAAWFVAAAIDHAPVLQRSRLPEGLRAAKSVDFSYPGGPADFTRPRTTTVGQFWRSLAFVPSCQCFRVTDRGFRPTFP